MNQARSTALFIIFALTGWVVLTGCSVSLASDITPPPDYTPAPEVTSTSPKIAPVYPIVKPDPASGQQIFAQECLPCHGAAGLGDGPQANKLPSRPPMIGTINVSRPAKPVDWFNLVTHGNLEKMMPPFQAALTDRERWDVVAYAMSLSVPPSDLTDGKTVYDQNCAGCHGDQGQGDGAQAASLSVKPQDWSNLSILVQASNTDLYNATSQGKGKDMPAYATKLNEAQIWAVVNYVRSLSFASPGSSQQASSGGSPTPGSGPGNGQNPGQASAQNSGTDANSATLSIAGVITNGSGGAVPGNLKVTLQEFNQTKAVGELSADVQTDGSFQFSSVPVTPDLVYLATVVFNGMTFHSDMLKGSDLKAGSQVSLPIMIYETSTDPSPLTADRLHVFFEFTKPDVVQVIEMYIISNPTNKVIVPNANNQPVVSFDLPEGATNLQFQDGTLNDRYLQTAKGFGDTQSIMPAPAMHQILFAYELPYSSKLSLSLKQPVPVTATVLAVPGDGVRLMGGGLQDAGQRTVQGVSFRFYNQGGLGMGSTLDLTLSGRPGDGSSFTSSASTGMIIGISAFAVALGLMVYVYLRRRRSLRSLAMAGAAQESGAAEPLVSIETLLDAIITLDDQLKEGKLSQQAYQERRAELKEKLRSAQRNAR